MATIRRTALFALALLNVACAKESTKPAEATVTAAEMSTVQADRARLMRERDEARDELVDSQRRYDQEIEAAIERDQVADATWAAYDAAQAELKVLADKGGKLKGRAKEQFYTLLQDAMLKRDVVHSPQESRAAARGTRGRARCFYRTAATGARREAARATRAGAAPDEAGAEGAQGASRRAEEPARRAASLIARRSPEIERSQVLAYRARAASPAPSPRSGGRAHV
jgi:hypothetical protein